MMNLKNINRRLRQIIDYIVEPVVTYPKSAIFLPVCMIISYLLRIYQRDGALFSNTSSNDIFTIFRVFIYDYAFVYILLLIVTSIKRLGKIYEIITLVVSWMMVLLISLPSIFLQSLFNTTLTSYHLQLLHETNPNESGEFISTYIISPKCTSLFLIILSLLAIVLVVCLTTKILLHKLPKILSSIVIIFVAFFSILSLSYFAVNIKYLGPNYHAADTDAKSLRNSPLHQLVSAYWQYQEQKNDYQICIQSQQPSTVDSCSFISPKIVLIVGESYNRHHSELYGYPLNTNPKLSKRQGLYVFSDVITPAIVTFSVFRDFLSCASIDDSVKWYKAPLFPKVFKEAGYNVVFYSNQFVCGMEQDKNDADASFINIKEISNVCFDKRNNTKYKFDGDLIKDYQQHCKQIEQGDRNLLIFHLMGQHIAPKERYRPENAVFDISDIKRDDLSDVDKQSVADYDNATVYNDSVVDAIMGMYDSEDAIVIYFADHGDEVNDFRLHTGRGGDFAECGNKLMHCVLDIPFMIYCTSKYSLNHSEIVERIKSSVNNPYMIDEIPHLMFDLAGIYTKWFDPKRSVINEKFNNQRKRLIFSQDSPTPYNYDQYCKKTDPWPNTQISNRH